MKKTTLWIQDNREAVRWEKGKTKLSPLLMAWPSAQVVGSFAESGNTERRTGFRES